jgi:nucleoside-diphosphate-sugar epimerase
MEQGHLRIAVTGANGFLGRHIVDKLKKKFIITCLVRRNVTIPGTAVKIFETYDDKIVEDVITDSDIVIHAAAQIHGDEKIMTEANVRFTKKLVALSGKGKTKYFIYISTENVNHGSTDIYTKTKRLAEEEVKRFAHNLILRPTVIYGPGDIKYVGRVIKIIEKFPVVPVLGSGDSLFQFIYIDDLTEIINQAVVKEMDGIYTVAGPQSYTYNEFMYTLMEVMSTKKGLFHTPLWILKPISYILNMLFKNPSLTPTQLDNLAMDRIYDISKIITTFNYKPTELSIGLKKMLTENHEKG